MTRRTFLAVVASTLIVLLADSKAHRAGAEPVTLPRMGDITVLMDTITVTGTLPPGGTPSSDLSGFCRFQNFNPSSGPASFFYAVESGIIVGGCASTSTTAGTKFTHDSVATGTVDPSDGAFTLALEWEVAIESSVNPKLVRHLSATLEGTLSATGFAEVTANYTYTEVEGDGEDGPGPAPDNLTYSGTVKIRVNLAQVASIPIDVTIDSMEFVQVIQDEDESLELTWFLPTTVRVFVKSSSLLVPGVTGTIVATDSDGDFLPGEAKLIGGPATASPNPQRSNLEHSLEFSLPITWLTGGFVLYLANVTVPVGTVESNTANNEELETLSSRDDGLANRWTVDYIRICHPTPANCPFSEDVEAADLLFKQQLPLSPRRWSYEPFPIDAVTYTKPLATVEDVVAFHTYVRKLRAITEVFTSELDFGGSLQTVAWLPGNSVLPAGIIGGSQNYAWDGWGRYAWSIATGGPADQVNFAKFVAHNLGAGLPGHSSVPNGDGCLYEPSEFTNRWLYPNANVNGWGFDQSGEVLISPTSHVDITADSGCPGPRWASPQTFTALSQKLQPLPPALGPGARATTNVFIVSGSAPSSGVDGTLDATYRMVGNTAALDIHDPAGNHCLVSYDDANELFRHCFDLTFTEALSGEALDEEAFSFTIPWAFAIDTLKLFRGNTELASMSQTLFPPHANITYPQAGDVLEGTETITWAASDDPGEPITFTLLYSPINEEQWFPLAVDITETSYTVNVDNLLSGTDVRFRLLASDGLNTWNTSTSPVRILGQYIKGDADCSGAVELEDVLLTGQSVAGLAVDADCLDAADVDCSGGEEGGDMLAILRHLVALPVEPVFGCPPIGER